MSEVILEVKGVSKKYKLGQIGATTLREELQRFGARLRGAEDPTVEIGGRTYRRGEAFLALSDVSFTVNAGEKVGVIGRNGAGKSTLLKLISRITAPTGGSITIGGRVASMLEVGTGFHPELTGRENVYMNGAILGMTKKEIDKKLEDIIGFSECRTFIDTPVKRYSSGMYVKLAFAVAAHLDCEIMIMDEVLAVGDMAFQQKCLEKMNEVSNTEGRTILYVSHNMNTIRRLCDRCIVLDGGKLVFDGDVEKAIEIYAGMSAVSGKTVEFTRTERKAAALLPGFVFKTFSLSDRDTARYKTGEKMTFYTTQDITGEAEGLRFRAVIYSADGSAVTSFSTEGETPADETARRLCFTADISALAPGSYTMRLGAYKRGAYGRPAYYDTFDAGAVCFEVSAAEDFNGGEPWNSHYRGSIAGNPLTVNTAKTEEA